MEGWVYEQSTGHFTMLRGSKPSRLVGRGYAGAPGSVNDPEMDHVRSKGPLPKGRYRIREVSHPRFAAPALRLDPEAETVLHGRSGFYIHGDNIRGNRSASSGCIILDRTERQLIRQQIRLGHSDILHVVK